MAKIKFIPGIKSVHGRVGNVIYYNVKGYQYARAWSIPRNPKTEPQQRNRVSFAMAVQQWQELPFKEKARYNSMAMGQKLNGYNIFISMSMKGITPAILKLIRHSLKAGRLLPSGRMIAVTSVIDTPSSGYQYISRPETAFLLRKPPGTLPAAA